ncbi:MAG: TonB-dependent receptor plug domain-containing protein [Bacteroidetes bacterium]|nr:TonB-dependent receptor plug domain-containing protein [Bacteroidota bacterium]
MAHFSIAAEFQGLIRDKYTREPLIGATVQVKGTSIGISTGLDGTFVLKYEGVFPVTLVYSYLGYKNIEKVYQKMATDILVEMEENAALLKEAQVTDIRITQKQRQAPLTVESLDPLAIKETPAANFYEGLSHLKGVDISSASIGFKVINTRGFNSTSPVRSLQLIDGVDNQAPGLNFSLGNFLGAPELDVMRVDLIAGASSAYYGPNAFNGVIMMQSKDPFATPGFTAQVKVGERNLVESAVRWAQVYKDKNGKPRFAYKVNLYYMHALDWQADNRQATPQSHSSVGNPGGWDQVNNYGDEYNRINDQSGSLKTPGLGIYYRTGYHEIDLVNYNTNNIKTTMQAHYLLKDSSRIIYAFNFGYGTTVYQGDNRMRLKDIVFFQNRLEWKKNDKFFIRMYSTNENAGKSYDSYRTALVMQGNAKNDAEWGIDYANYWNKNIDPRVRALPGFPGLQPGVVEKRDSFLNNYYYDSLVKWHQMARNYADYYESGTGQSPRYTPGTHEFDSAFRATTNTLTTMGGSLFYDRSSLYHIQGQRSWDTSETGALGMEFTIGASGRMYVPNSAGTIFLDTNGRVIRNYQGGVYGGAAKYLLHNAMKVSATLRMDKNINFPLLFSPAASAVYNHKVHTYRMSFSSAIRNPTLTDQYFNMNVGRATLLGNLNGYNNLVSTESYLAFLNSTPRNPEYLKYFNVKAVRPERVTTAEIGYRSVIGKKLFIDANYYYSWYTHFLGYIIGVEVELDSVNAPYKQRIVRVTTNSNSLVTTQGFSLGLNYFFKTYLSFNGNYTFNVLDRKAPNDPIIPAYNTPKHKFNLGITGRDVKIRGDKFEIRDLGYSVNFRWVQGFLFEGSPQFTGEIPTYYQLDAQISWLWAAWKTTFKLGASNLTNKRVYQVYGGPLVGRLVYFSATYQLDDWK